MTKSDGNKTTYHTNSKALHTLWFPSELAIFILATWESLRFNTQTLGKMTYF